MRYERVTPSDILDAALDGVKGYFTREPELSPSARGRSLCGFNVSEEEFEEYMATGVVPDRVCRSKA